MNKYMRDCQQKTHIYTDTHIVLNKKSVPGFYEMKVAKVFVVVVFVFLFFPSQIR